MDLLPHRVLAQTLIIPVTLTVDIAHRNWGSAAARAVGCTVAEGDLASKGAFWHLTDVTLAEEALFTQRSDQVVVGPGHLHHHVRWHLLLAVGVLPAALALIVYGSVRAFGHHCGTRVRMTIPVPPHVLDCNTSAIITLFHT